MSLAIGFRAGFRSAWGGLRPRAVATLVGGPIVLALLVGLLEQHAARAGAADRALATVFRLLVPLSAAATSAYVIGPRNLRDAAAPVARFGHPRAGVALGQLALVTAMIAATTLLVVLAAVVTAHAGAGARAATAPLGADLFTSGWISLLVGAAYAAWFGLGATLGKHGGGRAWVLVADFVIGATGFFGAVMPRGVAYELIGHASATDLGQRATSGTGAAAIVVLWGLVALRCRD